MQQYADDLMTVVVELESIEEIFEVFRRYELATNARLNKTKTEALWVGGGKIEQAHPMRTFSIFRNLSFLNPQCLSLQSF